MKRFKHFTHIKENTVEEVETLYDMLGINKKGKTISDDVYPHIDKVAELLKWNAEIESIEEGKESGHTLRVAYLSKRLAEEIGLNEDDTKDIYFAALFHDIGKHLIPKKILGKPGPLTTEEYETMKTHVSLAEDLVKDIVNERVVAIIKGHHERMDGSGYPDGIVPSNMGIRILGLVDSYDAMTSRRVYSSPKTKELAFQELKRCTIPKEEGGFGHLYDARLVDILEDIEDAY